MQTQLLYIMGVSGSGKTTIGQLLANELEFKFYDGDDFHPEANIQKMQSGQPLNDEDRQDWLLAIHHFVKKELPKGGIVIACSALKNKYRLVLESSLEATTQWIYLAGTYDFILKRMQARTDHFMPSALLQSQFDILEIPEKAIEVDIKNPPKIIVEEIIKQMKGIKAEFGLIGLGVMGKSLSRNLANNGFRLALYNRHVPQKEENVATQFIAAHAELSGASGHDDLKAFITALDRPRKVFLMINAGTAIDDTIDQLLPLLDAGDMIMDGGNTHYKDTERRTRKLEAAGIHYLGTGVSGGEEGALKGPSIMPGGSSKAYELAKPYLEKIAAKDAGNGTCCAHIGRGGAGHFVKMVHNGIEYAEMQLIAEVYSIMRWGMQLEPNEIAEHFEAWQATDLSSYLLEISIDILRKKEGGKWLIDLILDKAGNKGTGSWTTIAACELGVPIPTISAALFARYISAFKTERSKAADLYQSPIGKVELTMAQLRDAYALARIINHHQGIHLIDAASAQYNWEINLSELARIWTNGCIIRSTLMQSLIDFLASTHQILSHEKMIPFASAHYKDLSATIAAVVPAGIAIPCCSSAIQYYNAYIQHQSSANVIQAQRDYFGAHTYERVDDYSGRKYHTVWKEGT